MSDGFVIDPNAGGGNVNLDTLFGVAQGVGDAPVTVRDAGGITAAARNQLKRAGEDVSGIPIVPDAQAHPVAGSLQDIVSGIYTASPDTVSQFQRLLLLGGYYPSTYYGGTHPKQVRPGVVDADTYTAWKQAVVEAARSRKPLMDLLNNAAASGPGFAQGAGGAPKQGVVGGANTYTNEVTNAVDLNAVVNTTAQSLLGRDATPDEQAKITAAIQAQQRAVKQAQINASESQSRAQYNAQVAERNATAAGQNGADTYIAPVSTSGEAAPDPQAAAAAALRLAHPTEVAAHDSTSVYSTLLSLIRGGGGA